MIVVDDELRQLPKPGRQPKAETLALRDGKTVFVPLDGVTTAVLRNRLASAASRVGFKVSTRQHEIEGVRGLVAWWTPKEAQ